MLTIKDPRGITFLTNQYDGNGRVSQQTQADAPTTSGAATSNTFGFTGREADGTGLHYYRARYYDARLQRFTSEDPIGFSGGTNVFAYVENMATMYVDPLGLKPSPRFGKPPGRGPRRPGAPAGPGDGPPSG